MNKKFVRLELLMMFFIPSLIVGSGHYMGTDPVWAYVRWLGLMLSARGFIAVIWDVYAGYFLKEETF